MTVLAQPDVLLPVHLPAGTYTPVPAVRWTQDTASRALASRSQGRCEGCAAAGDLERAHRDRRSAGGRWAPANLLHLCRGCHSWAHSHERHARGLGWELIPGSDPTRHPAWIMTVHSLEPWWHMLLDVQDAEGVRQHLAVPVDPVWTW